MEAALLTMNIALVTIVAATFVAVLGSIHEQRRAHDRLRDRLDAGVHGLEARVQGLEGTVQGLIARTTTLETGQQRLAQDLAEHSRMTEKNFAEVNDSLTDTRERLARIEGHLGIGIQQQNAVDD